jgi:TonB family protein
MAEGWTKGWERRIVNGVYPLRRFLGQSDHSVVFLTDHKARHIVRAAIKILPANPALSETQLAHWKTVATLSHPHVIRLFDAGRCQLGGHDFLFVVMEYAEQNLAQILPGRALIPSEVRELLPATLDALAYLHCKNLVQGALKPPNFLVVQDQLKLASDAIRPAGERTASTATPSLYDPPEAKDGGFSTAGDIWGLGITLTEALTQTPPAWSRERSESVSLPANLAPEFAATIQRCLNRDANQRPTVAELIARFNQPPPATPPPAAAPIAAPVASAPWIRALFAQLSTRTRWLIIAVTVGIITVWAVWTGTHLAHTQASIPRAASITPQSPPTASAPAAVESPRASTAALPSVLHQALPEVSRSARESIHGVIKIAVRVNVDRSGNVVAAALDSRASSQYFARAALDAAKKWKFAPAADQATRVWLLHFEFSRAGAKAHTAALR